MFSNTKEFLTEYIKIVKEKDLFNLISFGFKFPFKFPFILYQDLKLLSPKNNLTKNSNNSSIPSKKFKREEFINRLKSSSFVLEKREIVELENVSDIFKNISSIRNYSHHISCKISKDWVDGNLCENKDYKEMNDFYTKSTGNNFPLEEQIVDENEIKEKNDGIHYPYSIENLHQLGSKFKFNEWKVDEVLNDFVGILDSDKEGVGDEEIIRKEFLTDDNLLFVTPYSMVSEKWIVQRQVNGELSIENMFMSGDKLRDNYKFSSWSCPNSISGLTLQPQNLEMIYKYSYVYFCNKFYLTPISNLLKEINLEDRLIKVKTRIASISFENDGQLTELLRFSRFIEGMKNEIENHIERLWSGGGLDSSKSKKIDDFSKTYQIFPDSILKLNYHYGPSTLGNLDLEETIDFYESMDLGFKLDGQFFVEQLSYFQNKLFLTNYLIQCLEIMVSLREQKLDFEYRTLYLNLEGLNIFESSIEIEKLNELKEINEGLFEINNSLLKINNSIVKGFEDVKIGLNKISGQISYNNLLNTINTYQLYKINKNTKNFRS
jgi:hypothetical protein